ncbi:MAG: bifunctional nuclease family protein [Candidatus Liptonbacteria bacterium]|nr:bifunctional nuclease family protein [Candidatus Liptonbacteria bacterium]
MEIEVKVEGFGVGPSMMPVLVLGSPEHEKKLCIGCDEFRTFAIATQIGLVPQEPMPHDLVAKTIGLSGGALKKIVITRYDAAENLFWATAHVDRNGETATIEWGPTDLVAVALRTKSPIYVESDLLEREGVALPQQQDEGLSGMSTCFDKLPKQ